ncbi:MAG: carboxypeptidase-like regulatory domain-containing protein [Bacteroidota bacterium]
MLAPEIARERFKEWCFTLLFFIPVSLFAQSDYLTLKGKVVDSQTQTPLPFALLSLKGTSISTTTNAEGDFIFHIPVDLKENLLVVAMMGYTSTTLKPAVFEEQQTIHLEEAIHNLEEVTISADKQLSAKQIIKRAYKALPDNYPTQPYLVEGFIRDLQKEDSTYVEFLEYAVKLAYQPYNVKQEPKVALQQVRRSYIAQKHPWNEDQERQNAIMDLIEDDFIRFNYGPIKVGKGWQYTIEQVLPYNGHVVYKILGQDRPFQEATLYIDTESFAFVKMELIRTAHKGKSWRRRLTSGQQQMLYQVVFEYQRYKDKWYLKYQKEEDTWQIYEDLLSDKLLFTKYPKKELFINRIIVENIEAYPFVRNLNIHQSVEDQAPPYDPTFWKYYNAPAQTKTLSRIEAYLKEAQVKEKR